MHREMSKLKFLILLLLIIFNNISFSQTNDTIKQRFREPQSPFVKTTDTIITFKPVEITAEKVLKEKALVKIILDSTIMQHQFNNTLSDVLSEHSPVFVKTYGQGSLATVSMRGTAASHTQVEWNGININSPMLGQVDFSQIPIWFVDQVEISPGSSSLQTGSGAIGGSVNIASQPAFNRKFYGSVVQGVGSFETYQRFIQIGGGNSNFQLRLRLFDERSKNNFEYYNNANGLWNYENQKNATYNKKGLLAETNFRIKKNLFTLAFWWHQSNRNLPPIMSFEGSGRNETQFDDDMRLSFNWKKFHKNGFTEFISGFSIGKLNYYLANETNLGVWVSYNTSSKTKSSFAKFNYETSIGEKTLLKWNSNIEFFEAYYFNLKTETGFDVSRLSVGSSIAVFHKFKTNFSGYFLFRDELVDSIITPIMPSLGLECSNVLIKNFTIKTNISRNYHQPTLNDLYWNPGGNPLLKPEKGYSADLGFYYSTSIDSLTTIKTSASVFASLVDDWIVWQPSEFRYWTATNLQHVFARGLESRMDVNTSWKKIMFGLNINYTLTKTANKEVAENGSISYQNQLIYIPIHKANAMVNVFYRSFSINYAINYTSERFTIASNETTRHYLPSYALHDIGFGKSFEFWKLKIDMKATVNNIFNTDYQAILWRAMPRRNWQVFLKISF